MNSYAARDTSGYVNYAAVPYIYYRHARGPVGPSGKVRVRLVSR